MTAAAFPEDSILRRHAETERLRTGLPPTDSVLRRHYEQLQSVSITSPQPAPQAKASATAKVTPLNPRPAPAAAPAQDAKPAHNGGLLGWLKRLLSA